MNIRDFESALDRYGGDFKRWPADLRSAAEALVAGNRTAAELARVAGQLELALARAVEPLGIDAAFAGGIVAGLAGARARDEVRPTPRLVAWAGAAMVAFLVAGYAIGQALPASTAAQSDDAIASLLFGDSSSTMTGAALGGLL
jgi:hypothetical protein